MFFIRMELSSYRVGSWIRCDSCNSFICVINALRSIRLIMEKYLHHQKHVCIWAQHSSNIKYNQVINHNIKRVHIWSSELWKNTSLHRRMSFTVQSQSHFHQMIGKHNIRCALVQTTSDMMEWRRLTKWLVQLWLLLAEWIYVYDVPKRRQ